MKYYQFLVAAMMVLCLASSSPAADSKITVTGCFTQSKFQDLHKYIGTYLAEEFINDPAVLPKLETLTGKNLDLIRTNLNVHGQIDLCGCNLVVQGNAPHKGFEENVIVLFDLVSGDVTAGIKSETFKGKLIIYNRLKDYNELPFAIKQWLSFISQDYVRPPFEFR